MVVSSALKNLDLLLLSLSLKIPFQSELAFRLLCRRHGATCAYTPMMHARLFAEVPSYRAEQFSTVAADRPLMAQFCGNDPATVLAAARILERRGGVDAIDLNLGCPQRIAKRGRYGAFLMDEPELVSGVVSTLAAHLSPGVKVTAKMRIFAGDGYLERTVAFARMLEASGASLVAVHGRSRDAKDAASVRADWDAIAAVKSALRVPVLANGDVLCLGSARRCLEATGCDGVLSAIPLLEDPALFSESRGEVGCRVRPVRLLKEYALLAAEHATPARMARGHAFRMLGDWLSEHTDLRDALNGVDQGGGAARRRTGPLSAGAERRRLRRERKAQRRKERRGEVSGEAEGAEAEEGGEEDADEEEAEAEEKAEVANAENSKADDDGGGGDDDGDGNLDEAARLRRSILFDGSGLLTPRKIEAVADELLRRISESGRDRPVPVVTERAALRAAEAEAAAERKREAIEEAEREERALASIGVRV